MYYNNNEGGCFALLIIIIILFALVSFIFSILKFVIISFSGVVILISFFLAIFFSSRNFLKSFIDYQKFQLFFLETNTTKPSLFMESPFSISKNVFVNSFNLNRNQLSEMSKYWKNFRQNKPILGIIGTFSFYLFLAVDYVIGTCTLGILTIVLFFSFLILLIFFLLTLLLIKLIQLILKPFNHHSVICPTCNTEINHPVYICPNCGRVHNDLKPNKNGIFLHICQCGVLLPTIDLFGRNQLAIQCPNDKTIFIEANLSNLQKERVTNE